jgi:hypothetical protein
MWAPDGDRRRALRGRPACGMLEVNVDKQNR